jgi:solute carrier family 13 (sodium-dependent dicarboxylate transporter), member 2/3/5
MYRAMRPDLRAVLRITVPVASFVLVYAALSSLGHDKAIVGAIFGMTVALWITELIPLAVAALLSTSLLVLLGEMPEKEAYAAYGDPIIPLFIGSFLLAKAMDLTGLGQRFAYAMLAMRWASRSPAALLLALGSVSCIISLLVSNTAVTAMMLPVGLATLSALHHRREGSAYAVGVMLMLTWGSSVAVGLPVGTPPNLIGISLIEQATNTRIGFVQWMAFAMPITILVMVVCWALLWMLYRKDAPTTEAAAAAAKVEMRELGPMKQSEMVVLAASTVAMLLWILPDSMELALGKPHPLTAWLQAHLTAPVAAIAAAALLFLLPAKDRESGRALTWLEGARIDWGTILLFGGGIALGGAMFKSGLAKELGEMASRLSGAHTLWSITALSIVAAIILSELASNTAAATTLVPVAIGLAQGAGVSPIAPALGAAIGASFGFMLPVSTAPNAIVYSSGLVPAKEMMKAGLLLDLISALVIWGGLRIALPMLGLA